MKKYISVFEMLTRSTLYKVLLLLIVLVPLQLSLFWSEMTERLANTQDGIELMVDESFLTIPLGIGFVLITVILCWSGCNIGSNQGYTLRRLQITERAVYLLQTLYNCLCYLLLWGSQIIVVLGISWMYQQHALELTNQTIVLAFYRNAYLHSILPMEDAVGWILLVSIILGCGITAARFPYLQRRGKVGFSVILTVGTVLFFFPRGINEDFVLLPLYFVCLLVSHWVYWVFVEKEERE